MPTLRSATASASPAATPSPSAASTPRGAKRRRTPGSVGESSGPSRHTSPHRSPRAGAGTVRSAALLGLPMQTCSAARFFISPVSPVEIRTNCSTLQACTPKLLSASPKSSRKRLYGDLVASEKPKWNPLGKPLNFHPAQMRAVKEAIHVATVPSCELVCRDYEQRRVFEFCKAYAEESLVHWADEIGMEAPDSVAINCTNLANTSEIFSKILGQFQNCKKGSGKLSPLQQLQSMFSNKESVPRRMMLVIVDEMDYLITRDRAVLHDIFMLTTCPYSRCILIGIANAIDLADRFLPRLESLN
nr:unnamed protein product [Digitaria exilis]